VACGEATVTALQFQVRAGALIRGRVRREIESAAWAWGIDLETREVKGFLESLYLFRITSTADRSGADLQRFHEAVSHRVKEIGTPR